jgi:hypothetical protein
MVPTQASVGLNTVAVVSKNNRPLWARLPSQLPRSDLYFDHVFTFWCAEHGESGQKDSIAGYRNSTEDDTKALCGVQTDVSRSLSRNMVVFRMQKAHGFDGPDTRIPKAPVGDGCVVIQKR